MKYLILSVLFPLILNRAGDNRLGSSSTNGIVCSGRSAACCTRLQLTCSSRQAASSQPVLSSIHLIQEDSHWDFFFSLWSLSLFYLCSDISGAIRAIASCEISLACRGDNWECGMWEVCLPKQAAGRQHGLWNVDSKTKATSLCSSPVLVFWSSSMSLSDLINWDTSHEKRIKEPLKSLWSALYVWDYTNVLVIYIFLHSFFPSPKRYKQLYNYK